MVITHGPPKDIGDKTDRGLAVGDLDLRRELLERVKPKFHIFGHIHEGYGVKVFNRQKVTEVDGTTFINASSSTVNYKPTNPPIVVKIKVPE